MTFVYAHSWRNRQEDHRNQAAKMKDMCCGTFTDLRLCMFSPFVTFVCAYSWRNRQEDQSKQLAQAYGEITRCRSSNNTPDNYDDNDHYKQQEQ